MAREGDNENDKYYVLIQTRSGQIIVKPNRFGQVVAIALGLLNFQCKCFPTSFITRFNRNYQK